MVSSGRVEAWCTGGGAFSYPLCRESGPVFHAKKAVIALGAYPGEAGGNRLRPAARRTTSGVVGNVEMTDERHVGADGGGKVLSRDGRMKKVVKQANFGAGHLCDDGKAVGGVGQKAVAGIADRFQQQGDAAALQKVGCGRQHGDEGGGLISWRNGGQALPP